MTNPPNKPFMCSVRVLTGLLCFAFFAGCGAHSSSMVTGWSKNVSADLAMERRLRAGLRLAGGENASDYAKLASLRLASKDPSGAQDDALRGLSLRPKHVGCLLFLARAQRGLGQLSESSESYAALVAASPSALETVRDEWAGILHKQARQAIARQNGSQLGKVLEVLGSEAFEGGSLAQSKSVDYAVALVGIHLRNKDLEQARMALDRSRNIGVASDKVLFLQAQIKASTGSFEASKKLFKRWAETQPSPK